MSTSRCIPLARPYYDGREIEFVQHAFANGHIHPDGPFGERCEELLAEIVGASDVLVTSSGTAALEMSSHLLGIGPGDEVIVPSFGFVTTASAFVASGARPVFADVREDTLNIDETHVEALIGERTRAVVALHYAGVACEMRALGELAAAGGADIVEDNAHGLFGRYQGRKLGSFGRTAIQSFDHQKNVSCGQGGALVLNDPSLRDRARVIRDKGTNRAEVVRGKAREYTWVDVGSNYLLSDLSAAVLYAQLLAREQIQRLRARLWETYMGELSMWATEHGVQLPSVPPGSEPAHHLFFIILPSKDARERLTAHLVKRGVSAAFHYLPLHLSPVGRALGGRAGSCPVTERAAERLLRLPFYAELSDLDAERVLTAVCSFDA